MAHYAHVLEGQVVDVHVVSNQITTGEDGVEREELGRSFLAQLHGYDPATLVQCSYNANFRNCYPGVGFTYDSELDIFEPPLDITE